MGISFPYLSLLLFIPHPNPPKRLDESARKKSQFLLHRDRVEISSKEYYKRSKKVVVASNDGRKRNRR
jgi:hypothetical protein